MSQELRFVIIENGKLFLTNNIGIAESYSIRRGVIVVDTFLAIQMTPAGDVSIPVKLIQESSMKNNA